MAAAIQQQLRAKASLEHVFRVPLSLCLVFVCRRGHGVRYWRSRLRCLDIESAACFMTVLALSPSIQAKQSRNQDLFHQLSKSLSWYERAGTNGRGTREQEVQIKLTP